MRFKQLCLCLIFFMSTIESFAWGPIGHRVVGEVAKRHLNYFTKKKVEAILGAESMAKASTWADEIKSDPDNYKHTFDWHYMSWPMDESDYTYKEGGGKLIKAIKDNVNILRSEKSTKTRKIHALRFIIHLVGDLHQPLHVGNGLDRGGNDCKVFFHKGKTNLHRLWDEDMINRKKLSFSEIVEFISYFSKEEIKTFMQGSPLDWAKESRPIDLKFIRLQ